MMATLTDLYDTGATPVEVVVEELIMPRVTTGTAVYRVLDSTQPTYAVGPPTVQGSIELLVDTTNYFDVLSMLWSGHALRIVCTSVWHLDLAFIATDIDTEQVSGPAGRRRLSVSILQVTATPPAGIP